MICMMQNKQEVYIDDGKNERASHVAIYKVQIYKKVAMMEQMQRN